MIDRAWHGRSLVWAAVLVTVAIFALKLFVAVELGLDPDEAYYTLWSAHLALGYYDHPPAVAVGIALGRLLAGESHLGVRLFALGASLIVAAALYRTGRLLFPNSASAALSVIWYSLCLLTAINVVATPDAPSTLFWVLTVWVSSEAVVTRRPVWWLATGLFAGLGLASKYTNAFLGAGLVLYLLGTADGRTHLRHWQLWAGGLLALLVFSPVLWWNAENSWRSFLFQGARVVGESDRGSFTLEWLVGQALLLGPFLLVFAALGAATLLQRQPLAERPGVRLLVLTSAPVLLYFLVHSFHSRVEANWTQPVVPSVTLLAAWAAVTLEPPSRLLRQLARLARVLQPLLGAVLVLVVIVQALFQPFDLGGLDRTAKLRGWQGLYDEVHELAEAVGTHQVWTERDYGLNGELFTYALFAGDAMAVRDVTGHVRYDFLPPLDRTNLTWPAIYIRKLGRGALQPPDTLFGSTRLAGIAERRDGGRALDRYAVFVVSQPKAGFFTLG